MKPESTDQDELQRMLALKRQERPPQQFFKGLSTAVIDRIQHPEPPPPPTFRQRCGLDFDSKPVLVFVAGVAVCGLLAYVLASSRHVKEPPPAPPTDGIVPNLAVRPTPGQMDSTPPVRAPRGEPEELPRNGEPIKASPAAPDSINVRPWPAPPMPPMPPTPPTPAKNPK